MMLAGLARPNLEPWNALNKSFDVLLAWSAAA